MCGILGVVSRDGAPADLDRLTRLLHHRGPDGWGTEMLRCGNATVALGHTRLSILDLSPAGHQPMRSRDGRWLVTFNGEIYDHQDLRADLDGPFRGHSDTETLVEGLAAFGLARVLPRLNGMYAFAAFDRLERKLHIARDPFGIKPVYVARTADGLVFASEVRVLRAALGRPLEVDEDGLQTFATLRYVPSPSTLWRGVRRIPPGHALTVDVETGQEHLRCFVTPTRERFRGSMRDAVAAWREVLRGAVHRQLLSDVPVGVLLSGGIDSAVVAALAAERAPELPTFSVGFEGETTDCELADAAETARLLGLPNAAVRVGPDDLWDALEPAVASVEEPLGTTSVLPMWHLVRRTRDDVTVVLTGQGNDEPWGGYRRYQAEVLRERLPVARLARLGALAGRLPGLPEWVERGFRTLPEPDRVRRFVEAYALFSADERRALLGTTRIGDADAAVARWLGWVGDAADGDTDRMLRVDSRMNLADDLLVYGDKISMSVALEARVPMLDLEVVRFVESLPRAWRVRLRHSKVVHRRMAREWLPERIVNRPKRGFRVPFGAWARGPWRRRVEEALLEPGLPHLDRLHRGGVERIWRDHLTGRRDRERQLFALLTLAVWWRQEPLALRQAA